MKKLLLFLSLIIVTFVQAQVSLVKDINPGFNDGILPSFYSSTSFNNKLVFGGYDGAVNGVELWMSDGSETGTEMVSNIFPSNGGSSIPRNFIEWQNELIFTANISNVTIRKQNPFRTNLTNSGTINFIDAFPCSIAPFVYNGELYLARNGQLYKKTDFSTSEQFLIINNFNGDFELASIFNGLIIYKYPTAFNQGQEIWATNGTTAGTYLLKDILSGPNSSNPSNFITFNNMLYFTANDGTSTDIWETDSTTAGTQRTSLTIAGFSVPQGALSNFDNFFVFNNELYFTATSATNGNELIKMDTMGNLTPLDIVSGSGGSFPFGFTIYNNEIYFAADDGINGVELWKTDGTPTNTALVKNINTSSESTPQGFTEYMGELFFNADDGVNGRELWKTNGTNAGTVLVSDINTGALDSDPLNLTVAGDNLFFSATTTATGRELFRYVEPSLSTNDLELENSIMLYPNPTTDTFSIKSNQKINAITINNIQGKLVKAFTENMENYNIKNLTSGIYFVTVKTDNGSSTKKLIKY